MAAYKIYFIGTQLLFLSHIAHSFILLTANMEDVKKIARKFVSESLAEKIAEFVAKATEQIVANVSEENDRNVEDVQSLTDENDKLENIGRVRKEKDTTTTKEDQKKKYVEFEYDKATVPDRKAPNDRTSEKVSNAGQVINWEKEVNEISYEKYSKEEEEKPKLGIDQREVDYHQKKPDIEQPKLKYERQNPDYEQKQLDYDQKHENEQQKLDYDQQNRENEQQKPDYDQQKLDYGEPKPDYDQPKLDYVQPKPDYDQPKPDYGQPKPNYDQPKPHYEQQRLDYEKPKARKPKIRPHQNKLIRLKEFRRPDMNTDQTHDPRPESTSRPTIYSTILYQKALRNGPAPKRPFRGHRLSGFDPQESKPSASNQTLSTFKGFNIPRSLTTQKARMEFDQYDNPNYPKAEFIATSGPVSLPKVPMMKPWWEKEMAVVR